MKVELTESTEVQSKVFMRQKNESWLVDYTPDGKAAPITLIITDYVNRETRFVDVPI